MLLPQLATPCEVSSLDRFLTDDSWVMEQKLDGHRLLLRSPGLNMAPTALTRSGTIYSRKLPQAIQDFRFPGPGQWALDGELVATVVNGHTVSSTFWVFDLPEYPLVEGFDHHNAPLWARRTALETLFANIRHPFKLVPQARTTDEKITLAARAIGENFEGLILKKVDSPYRSGLRTAEWLKAKFVVTADCVVLGVRDDGKESVRLGMYRGMPGNTEMVEVGRSSLIGKEKAGAIHVGDVVEVRYLYGGAGGRLYQPTIVRRRTDKTPQQCTVDQMKMVNKSVLEAL